MDLMEYQGKNLFRRYDIPTTPQGEIATGPEEAERLAEGYGVPVMVKAQVLTGGRGKAGGVKYCSDAAEARAQAEAILGLDIKGHTVEKVLVEPASDIAEEYYLSVLYDRVSKGHKVIASVEGGVEIEEVNRRSPEKVVKVDVDPTTGMDEGAARQIVAQARFPEQVREEVAAFLMRLYAGFIGADATLFEVNPLIRTTDGRIIALDSKVSIDGNAQFRQEELFAEAETGGGHPLEVEAKKRGLQYVKLDGDIGIMGNGAGLVMSTLDVVAEVGGEPANFLDAGGGASAESMAGGIAFVLGDPDVRCMLVNIFGGITRCDDVARGVLGAIEQIGELEQQLVVRLDGTNAEEGRRILAEADIANLVTAEKMVEGAEKAVELATQGGDR
jgi:succinyl-CoA synthetase beta subunit